MMFILNRMQADRAETGFIFVNGVSLRATGGVEQKDPRAENRLANVCWTVKCADFLTSYAIAWGLEP